MPAICMHCRNDPFTEKKKDLGYSANISHVDDLKQVRMVGFEG